MDSETLNWNKQQNPAKQNRRTICKKRRRVDQ